MGLRKSLKRIGRKALKVHAKVLKVAAPVVAGAATLFAGPVGGAAVSAAMGVSARYAAAAGARGDGKKGHAARVVGRSARARTIKYGLMGTGVGTVANLAIGGLGAAVGGLGGQSALGLGSGSGIGGLSNPLMSAAATKAAGGAAPGAVDSTPYTHADLYNGRAPSSGGAPIDGLVAGIPGLWNDLTGAEQPERPAWLIPALIVGGVLLLSQAS